MQVRLGWRGLTGDSHSRTYVSHAFPVFSHTTRTWFRKGISTYLQYIYLIVEESFFQTERKFPQDARLEILSAHCVLMSKWKQHRKTSKWNDQPQRANAWHPLWEFELVWFFSFNEVKKLSFALTVRSRSFPNSISWNVLIFSTSKVLLTGYISYSTRYETVRMQTNLRENWKGSGRGARERSNSGFSILLWIRNKEVK